MTIRYVTRRHFVSPYEFFRTSFSSDISVIQRHTVAGHGWSWPRAACFVSRPVSPRRLRPLKTNNTSFGRSNLGASRPRRVDRPAAERIAFPQRAPLERRRRSVHVQKNLLPLMVRSQVHWSRAPELQACVTENVTPAATIAFTKAVSLVSALERDVLRWSRREK